MDKDKARDTCPSCHRDKGLVFCEYEGRKLCLDCAKVWQKQENMKHVYKNS